MNKKIIAIAIASALTAPAMADGVVSGALGGDLVSRNAASAAATTNGAKTGSTVAMEDFGATKVQFDATTGNVFGRLALNMGPGTNNGTAPSYRDYFIGYKFDAGTFSFGVQAGAAKNLEKDAYIASFLETRGTYAEARTSGAYGSSGFVHNVLQWKMKAGSANVTFQYDPTTNVKSSSNEGHAAVAVSGNASGIRYWASYNNGIGADKGNTGTAATKSQSNIKAGAAMKFGTLDAGLNYTSADDATNKWNAIALDLTMGLGNDLDANVNFGSTSGDSVKQGTVARVAITKGLGKGAKVYAGYQSSKPKSGASQSMLGFGMGITF